MQRRTERTVRKLQRRKASFKAAGSKEAEQAVSIRIRRLKAKYKEFSSVAGLREQPQRMKAYKPKSSTENSQGTSRNEKYYDSTYFWKQKAIPNLHPVEELTTYEKNGISYVVDGHNVVQDHTNQERKIAEILNEELGEKIYMIPRVNNPQGVKTPDYLFNGQGYDLKTLSKEAGINTIYNRVKKGKGQSRNFIVDVSDASAVTDRIIDRQIHKIFTDTETDFVETLIILKDGMVMKVIEKGRHTVTSP